VQLPLLAPTSIICLDQSRIASVKKRDLLLTSKTGSIVPGISDFNVIFAQNHMPIIDWFYTADKLKEEGILILDDLPVSSVSTLRDFILEDPRWKFIKSFGRRALAARKIAKSIHDVAWHMQPYISRRYGRRARILNVFGIRKR
jgi:hypothetical protein